MHVPDERTEGHIVHQILHVVERILGHRTVVEHEHYAGHRQDQEQQKRDPTHPPCEPDVRSMSGDTHGMKMQEDVIQNHQRPVALVVLIAMPEDRFPDLVLGHILPDLLDVRSL